MTNNDKKTVKKNLANRIALKELNKIINLNSTEEIKFKPWIPAGMKQDIPKRIYVVNSKDNDYLSIYKKKVIIRAETNNHLKIKNYLLSQGIDVSHIHTMTALKQALEQKKLLLEQPKEPVFKNEFDLIQILSLLPGINSVIAKKLAKTDKSFTEITQLSVDELKQIKSVDKEQAELIFKLFNTTHYKY
ncbi:MAG: hypothetical protein GQ546_12905 [Gammaproteobacteria bacterium]|nr:hypothetical protein [Gammaproteobacteria bacterium]